MVNIDDLVNRFLTWPVPADVHPDGTPGQPGRTGTNLLTAEQAKQMLVHVLGDTIEQAVRSERRALMFGDILNKHILAMRAAVVDGHLISPSHGLQWIVNTLEGPGHLPNLEEARALGGGQALFDKEVAEAEAFRAAHPAP